MSPLSALFCVAHNEDRCHRYLPVGHAGQGLPVVIGQGSACTTILSAAEMQLHSALRNAQKGGEMTGFLRLGVQDIFSPITVTRGKACPPVTTGHGIEVNKEKLQRLAGRF